MRATRDLWNNFKSQPDVWFFYGFVLTLALSIRKVVKFYPIAGEFNEYAGVYLYLSDIFLLLTLIVFCGFILYSLNNKSVILSSVKQYFALYKPAIGFLLIFNIWIFVSILWSDNQDIALFRAIKILEFSLLFLYVSIRIVPLLPRRTNLFYACPVGCSTPAPDLPNVPRGTFGRFLGWNTTIVFQIIIILGLFQAIIGIWQFFVQHSVGLFWLKESLIAPDIDGVAKVILDGEKYIRAYGLFPHPNILGGFLLFSIVLTLLYSKLFHACPVGQNCSIPIRMFHVEHLMRRAWNNFIPSGVEQSLKSGTIGETCHPGLDPGSNLDSGSEAGMTELANILPLKKSSMWNIWLARFLPIFVGIQILALLLTFSKSAILGLLITMIYIYYRIVPRGTNLKSILTKMFHACPVGQNCSIPIRMFHVEHLMGRAWNNFVPSGVEQFGRKVFLIIGIIVVLGFILKPDTNSLFFKTLNERLPQINVSRGTILENPITGVGIGQFVSNMDKNVPRGTFAEAWQYQPVHNVFLLIWSELGIIGLVLFVCFLWKVISIDKNNKILYNINKQNILSLWIMQGIFFAWLFIMFFDHYLWDIQQGQILLWLTLGLIAGRILYIKKEKIID